MKFAFNTALKNIGRKPFRAMGMAFLIVMLSIVLFVGAFTLISLRNGLDSYGARLGADIVVVPNSAKGHGTVDDILLQGITGNYYMRGKEVEKLKAVEGIGQITTQFFLTSAKASCCSVRVQIIGFDPETDFSVLPFINENISGDINDMDVIAGCRINVPENRKITFYGQDYNVKAQLVETGTGLDSAVFANMNTVKQMAKNASMLTEASTFKGIDINTAASCVLINVADGYSITDVADDINIHISKVEATPAKSMVSQIGEGLNGVSKIIGMLVIGIWILSLVILIAVFALLSNERKKEFAVFRIMGASKKLLFKIIGAEIGMICIAGAVIGLFIGSVMAFPIVNGLQGMLSLPILAPNMITVILLALGTLLLSVLAGLITAFVSAKRITRSETGLLLREDG